MKGKFIIIVGPSTSGKTELVKALLKKVSNSARLISVTTRTRRPEEKDGVDYVFISRGEFEKRIKDSEFFEYAEVYGNLYGSSRKVLDSFLRHNAYVFAIIDIQGARTIKFQMPEAYVIFLHPGSIEVVHERMQKIRTDISAEQMKKRMETARHELSLAETFDAVVDNRRGHFDQAIESVIKILEAL